MDDRKSRLKKGLSQLNKNQLLALINAPKELLVMDEYYYHENKY